MKHTPSTTTNTDEPPVVLELQDIKKSFVVPGGDPLLILDIPFFQIAGRGRDVKRNFSEKPFL